jgi:hypothetical protein
MAIADTAVHDLLRLRLTVAALGELLPRPWWRSQFLSPTGLRYMERVFPRRFLAAALASTTVAACRDHDVSVGIRSYHLFRLPPRFEDRLSELAAEGEAMQAPGTVSEIVDGLTQLGSEVDLPSGPGPKSLGSVEDILKSKVLCSIAGLYARAAREETRTYPYFDAEIDD